MPPNPQNDLGQISMQDPRGDTEGEGSTVLLRSPQGVGKNQPLPSGASGLKMETPSCPQPPPLPLPR